MDKRDDTNTNEAAKMSVDYIDTADVAKLIRRELKVFKGTKFRVRSSRYAGGSSIRVSWTDGPTTDQVNEVVGFMHGATFDGMTDMQSYHDSMLYGEKVHFGNSFLFVNREISRDMFLGAIGAVAADWGPDVLKFEVSDLGSYSAYFVGNERYGNLDTLTVQRLVNDFLSETAF